MLETCLNIYSGPHTQSVASLIADLGVVSLIMARFHTFVENDHEIFATGSFIYKRKYVHKVLVNRLVKLAQENVWLG